MKDKIKKMAEQLMNQAYEIERLRQENARLWEMIENPNQNYD